MGFADNERKGIGAWSEEAGETKGKRLDERKERRGRGKTKKDGGDKLFRRISERKLQVVKVFSERCYTLGIMGPLINKRGTIEILFLFFHTYLRRISNVNRP